MKYIVTIAILLIGSIVMAGENCQKQTPPDTAMWFRAIDTTGWTNDGGHAWTPTLDSVWHKKVPIYLTPAEILKLRDMLNKKNCLGWDWNNGLRWMADSTRNIPCVQTYNGSGDIKLDIGSALDSTISTGVLK